MNWQLTLTYRYNMKELIFLFIRRCDWKVEVCGWKILCPELNTISCSSIKLRSDLTIQASRPSWEIRKNIRFKRSCYSLYREPKNSFRPIRGSTKKLETIWTLLSTLHFIFPFALFINRIIDMIWRNFST